VKWLLFDRVDDEIQQPNKTPKTKYDDSAKNSPERKESWGRYARGAVYALQSRGYDISKVITQ
jgi:galactokinase